MLTGAIAPTLIFAQPFLETLLAQARPNPDAAVGAGFLAIFGGVWCCGISTGLAQVVMAIIALIQVLGRETMIGSDKLLWALVS